MKRAEASGLDAREIVAIWGAGDANFNEALCRDRNARVIISKESGGAGGVDAKAEAARRLGIPMILIARPAEPEGVEAIGAVDGLLRWCEARGRA
jgi:precorrin-6x reductase